MLLDGDTSEAMWVRSVDDIRIIRPGGVDATVTVAYYKAL
jgi:hypothetical protein